MKQLLLTELHPHNYPSAPAGKDKTWTTTYFSSTSGLGQESCSRGLCAVFTGRYFKEMTPLNSYLTSVTTLTALTGIRPGGSGGEHRR